MDVEIHLVSLDSLADASRDVLSADAVRSSIASRYSGRALDESLAPRSRLEALAAGLLLRSALDVRSDAQLAFSAAGKPRLADGSVQMSLSHGGDCCALALAPAGIGPIGVDVEPVAPYCRPAARRVLPAADLSWIESAADPCVRDRRFCESWTRLESVLKADGRGFGCDLRVEGVPAGWEVSQTMWRGHIIALASKGALEVRLLERSAIELAMGIA